MSVPSTTTNDWLHQFCDLAGLTTDITLIHWLVGTYTACTSCNGIVSICCFRGHLNLFCPWGIIKVMAAFCGWRLWTIPGHHLTSYITATLVDPTVMSHLLNSRMAKRLLADIMCHVWLILDSRLQGNRWLIILSKRYTDTVMLLLPGEYN